MQLLFAVLVAVPPGTYRLANEASQAYVTLRPADTVLSGLSHRHVVVAPDLKGKVEVSPNGGCSIQVETAVEDLVVDPEAMRKELGFDKELSESDRKSVRKNMLAKGQLWAQSYPTIRFTADSCDFLSEGRVFVKGSLQIRGVSAPLYLPIRWSPEEGGFRIRTDFTKRHEDFGFEPYQAAFGALKNDETLRFHLDLRIEPAS